MTQGPGIIIFIKLNVAFFIYNIWIFLFVLYFFPAIWGL